MYGGSDQEARKWKIFEIYKHDFCSSQSEEWLRKSIWGMENEVTEGFG
jgi:hypothetical protein